MKKKLVYEIVSGGRNRKGIEREGIGDGFNHNISYAFVRVSNNKSKKYYRFNFIKPEVFYMIVLI